MKIRYPFFSIQQLLIVLSENFFRFFYFCYENCLCIIGFFFILRSSLRRKDSYLQEHLTLADYDVIEVRRSLRQGLMKLKADDLFFRN